MESKLTFVTKVLGFAFCRPAAACYSCDGVTYGAGTLMEMNEKEPLEKKDFILISILFFICHGINETTAIWCTVGSNVIIISAGMLILAGAVTMAAARLPFFKP